MFSTALVAGQVTRIRKFRSGVVMSKDRSVSLDRTEMNDCSK